MPELERMWPHMNRPSLNHFRSQYITLPYSISDSDISNLHLNKDSEGSPDNQKKLYVRRIFDSARVPRRWHICIRQVYYDMLRLLLRLFVIGRDKFQSVRWELWDRGPEFEYQLVTMSTAPLGPTQRPVKQALEREAGWFWNWQLASNYKQC
jgi:hypothetical protein